LVSVANEEEDIDGSFIVLREDFKVKLLGIFSGVSSEKKSLFNGLQNVRSA
jgi:hypothetical protein